MSIGAIKSINPFQNTLGANVSSFSSVNSVKSASIFGQNSNNGQNTPKVNSSSIFNQNIEFKPVSGTNPFAAVNPLKKALAGVVPTNAKANYMNGLAPSDNLQNVYAGTVNGKANFLNQIAIA